MQATDQFLAIVNQMAGKLLEFKRPDPRTASLWEGSLDEIMPAVYALKPNLEPDAFSELIELWSDYTNIPIEDFEDFVPSSNRGYMEDLLLNLLEEMNALVSGVVRN